MRRPPVSDHTAGLNLELPAGLATDMLRLAGHIAEVAELTRAFTTAAARRPTSSADRTRSKRWRAGTRRHRRQAARRRREAPLPALARLVDARASTYGCVTIIDEHLHWRCNDTFRWRW